MNDTTKPNNPFPQWKLEHPSFNILKTWWETLETDRGERAALRRAASLTEVMLSPAFHRLLNSLQRAGYGVADYRYPKLAAIVGLAARIKTETSETLATRMGSPKSGGDKATMSDLRIRRVLACDDIEELYTLLRRALALLGDQANLPDMAATLWHWSPMDEKRPNDPRRRLAYDYYAAAPL
jgi:CRISPR system Cascade subunit CasB